MQFVTQCHTHYWSITAQMRCVSWKTLHERNPRSEIQKEKYLLPIIFEGGKGTRGRKRLKRQMKGDIDDGCMRSIALTISGVDRIKAYIGIDKKAK